MNRYWQDLKLKTLYLRIILYGWFLGPKRWYLTIFDKFYWSFYGIYVFLKLFKRYIYKKIGTKKLWKNMFYYSLKSSKFDLKEHIIVS